MLDAERSREAVLAARSLVAPGGGIRMVEVARLPGAIDLIACATQAAPRDRRAWSPTPGGSGVGLCWEEALLSTVGEAIERSSLLPDDAARRRIVDAPYSALDRSALDPCRFNLYGAGFYGTPEGPRLGFSHEEAIPWFPAYSLEDAREVWIPAECVFFSCEEVPNHHYFCTTSGLASHRSPEAALVSALYELVERDAFVSTWLRASSPPAVDPAAFRDDEIDELLDRCASAGVALHLRDLSGELDIPTYLAIAEAEPGEEPAIGVGAATRLCGASAARKALMEAVHTWNWAYLKIDARGSLEPPELETYPLEDFGDHVYLYAHARMKEKAEFLLRAERIAAPRFAAAPVSSQQELSEVATRVRNAGYQVFAVDQTPADMAARGYHVLRAVAPGLLPIQTGRRIQQLCSPRAPTLPNPSPHPFP